MDLSGKEQDYTQNWGFVWFLSIKASCPIAQSSDK